jgi:hypothetical protein
VFDGKSGGSSTATAAAAAQPQQSRLEAFGFSGGSTARTASSSSSSKQRDAHGVAEEQGVLATDPAALATVSVTLASPFVPPLYLQHQGHSRTIIGYEVKRDGSVQFVDFGSVHAGLVRGRAHW